ncbi:uncharacterized protein LOC133825490 [Humulus lupulus]|uniref:uncharacterized protein LOC133825490 n=1 Tax=Humulus lupulus TaxID=3486 RepID=UPI002B41252E|nr:uncharacterized protein LOC133825490 [Humulus lupulus]
MKNLVDISLFTLDKHTTSQGYRLLCPITDRVFWSKVVWCRLNIPKHSFMMWLAVLKRLKTRDRLLRFQVIDNADCLLCSRNIESVDHLFFECPYSTDCLEKIKQWLNWSMRTTLLSRIIRWIGKAKISKFKKNLFSAVIAALVYQIWHNRNCKLWLSTLESTDVAVLKTKDAVKYRIMCMWPRNVTKRDIDWFNAL